MEGRDTPSRGLDITAKFLAMNLARWGFKPAGDEGSFFQRIDLRRDRADSGQTKVEFNGRALNAGTDYLPAGGSGTVSGQMVFAGTGWFVKSKEIDAYKGIDPAGKIAVIFGNPNQFPRGIARADFGKQGEDFMNPVDYARSKGVVGLIYVPDFQYLANWQRNRARIMERGSTVVAKFQTNAQTSSPVPSIVISPETANAVFAGESQAMGIFNASSGTQLAVAVCDESSEENNSERRKQYGDGSDTERRRGLGRQRSGFENRICRTRRALRSRGQRMSSRRHRYDLQRR